jgi:pyruvate dehydrogenase E2 component (dihydrolipoamide acetyltransferase)
MAVEIRLPQFGMAMQEGTIVHWFKEVGDTVEAGELLAEVEAAKSVEELSAPGDGVLQQILVPVGVTVPVHEVLALLGPPGSREDGPAAEPGAPAATAEGAAMPTATAGGAPPPPPGAERQVTPRARRLATELGVDLDTVVGSGPGGRVVDDDVRAATRGSHGAPGPGTSLPMSVMRRTVAQRMDESLRSSAQFTLMTTVDVTELVAFRDRLTPPRPSYLDFLAKAVALALVRHPRLNATLAGDHILQLADVHVGLATALEEGLVVPVVRHADRKTLDEIATESADLVRRAHEGAFTLDEISGSTFTISSLGSLGIDAFTPILNPPEVAILGVGRIVDQATRAGDALEWRRMITLSLTVDHRLVDGAPGAMFLRTVGELLGDPLGLT